MEEAHLGIALGAVAMFRFALAYRQRAVDLGRSAVAWCRGPARHDGLGLGSVGSATPRPPQSEYVRVHRDAG